MASTARKRRLVVLDECPQTLRAVARIAAPHFDVRMSRDSREAVGMLEQDAAVAVFVVERALGGGSGLALLESARTRRPDVRRVLLGDFAEIGLIVAGIHAGDVQQFVSKPLDEGEFLAALGVEAPAQSLRATA